jgi:hypothetical protein
VRRKFKLAMLRTDEDLCGHSTNGSSSELLIKKKLREAQAHVGIMYVEMQSAAFLPV